ncbi:MAG: CDP-alcohol phosphatidyltransferase family protein [Beijerinckiaceae bacterium]
MLDGAARRIVDPALDMAARRLVLFGIGANQITLFGLAMGLCCAAAIFWQMDLAALAFLFVGRIADGLDGAVARATRPTDFGGYLDIVCDFVFYGAVPLAFALRDPDANGTAAAALLFAFYANGASFLAYAAIAAKHSLPDGPRGPKALYYATGLMEGTETILFFAAFMLFPGGFVPLALVFAALCLVTCGARIAVAYRTFGGG